MSGRPEAPSPREWDKWPRAQRCEFALDLLLDAVTYEHRTDPRSLRLIDAVETARQALTSADPAPSSSAATTRTPTP